MADSFFNLEDEPLPSFLTNSLDSTGGRVTLGNVTLGSGPGLPVAASTVAKIRAGIENRGNMVEASYLEAGQLSSANIQCSNTEQAKFSLNFKDDLDTADDFIAAHRFSDMLVKIHMDESQSRTQVSMQGSIPAKSVPFHGRPTDLGSDLSTGLLTFAQAHNRDIMDTKPSRATNEEDSTGSDGADSDHFSGSVSSFLANEKLMSVDSVNSDLTDDDVDLNNLPDDELELYFNKLVPPAMQRGRVEGQELPAAGLPVAPHRNSNSSSTEQEKNREQFLDNYDQEEFRMPDVRLAATGMDSCPASDEEDTEDELEAARNNASQPRLLLLPSTSRQLVGESNRPSFRPGLEGGSSDDESFSSQGLVLASGIEHRLSAEGQVINHPVTGDGGGGDGSSGSEDSGSDGGVSTVPLPPPAALTNYDVLRGLGIVGSSGVGEDEDQDLHNLPGLGRNGFSRHTEIGDRVGPVGTGEANSPPEASAAPPRPSPVNWSMTLDRQEALDAMDSTQSGPISEAVLDSVYLRNCFGHWRPHNSTAPQLQGTQSSFHLSQVLPDSVVGGCDDDDEEEEDDGVDVADGGTSSLGLRGGPCGGGTAIDATDGFVNENNQNLLSTSLEAKYFSQSFHQEKEDSDDGWNHCPDNLEMDLQQGAAATNSVVYQNEEGNWVTDLAYYSSFEKEVDGNLTENAGQFQTEEFVPASNAIGKIIEDQEEFEKEHQFMQEEQIEAAGESLPLGDTSWKVPTSGHLLMRASQVSTEFERGNDSYLRLTLGEFFGQRSEALGCLGSGDEDDGVKRPSFGYIITSPEKREPFPLIRPSEFSSRDCSVLGNTVEISKEDTTLNAEDLDKTLEAPANRTSPKGDPDPQPREQEGLSSPNAPPEDPGSASAHQSCVSPDDASNSLMLSISTITSAIADASISADPSQLATMIMELSKRSKAKNHPGHTPEGTASHPFHQVDHSTLLEALQKSTCAGELSAFDMEKYLRKADVSGGSVNSDASLAHTVFDLTGWASNLSDSQEGFPAEERDASQSGPPGITTNEGRSTKEAFSAACAGRRQSASQRRTSIPRPKASCVATPSGSARRPLNSEPSSTANPCSSDQTNPSDAGAPPSRALKDVPVALGTACPQAGAQTSSLAPRKTSPGPQRTSPRPSKGKSALPCLRGSAPAAQGRRDACQPQRATPPPPSRVEKPAAAFYQSPPIPAQHTFGEHHSFSEPSAGEETVCNFRPSTSPLIHSSPSQTSFPSADGTASSPPSDRSALDRRPGCELSPQSTCSSPSLSRLTYISINDSTVLPTPETKKNDHSFALSTTIIRASPTPPVEPGPAPDPNARRPSKSLDSQTLSHQSKSLDALPPHACRSPERSGSALSCGRSQSECNFHRGGGNAEVHLPPGCGHHRRCSETGVPPLTKVDSGYAGSNPNIQLPGGTQPWGASTQACPSGGLVMPPTYPSEELRYVPMASFKAGQPQHAGLQSLLGGPTLFSSQLAQQYLGRDAPLHPGAYHMGGVANGLYSLSAAADPAAMHLLQGSTGPAGYHQLHRPHHSQVELGLMGKVFGQQHSLESWAADGLDELRGQVVVPEELRFPHACCVGIASQTSLSLFNPSKRWQQVSITVSSLAIDGAKVDSLPYQWLLVKNKTIIGPKSTEEQKVLLIPPQAGVYQCVLSVSSWPASAESDGAAARADVFAKRAVLTAVAENPLLEIEVGKSGCLDFGDVSEGGSKSFPLKILNRTHATVPIRLVISANASAWRCFSFSKSPVVVPAEESLQAGHMTQMSSPSIMNHVLHASYGENAESFMVWVHFRAPQKYTPMGELGPADEYNARIDVEVDCPGPSHVIRCIPVKARVGTARVHAPKDLQTISLSAPFGKSSQQDLPLKNAGNIDVQLKLKSKEADDCFSVKPDELHLRVGEERSVELSFTAQGSRKCRESLLTILVLPSGPQYEVALRGDVIPESHHGKPSSNAAAGGGCGGGDVPPILSNKQFVAWGGVTLGRAVQQKLVLRNNSPDSSHQLRLLIRGQDQDCFQLQSMFSPEERLTRHGELSIRPGEDVAVHLLFAPTRVACMLAKLEIKQSGVRPSQPGVKFTIPLSGYGGTSNIILEDQRKQADGYVATLTGVSAGRVNKVCLCVRNTGSRAAFIKAAAYSDMQTRQLMEPSVISLSPSQFVLKERTQEVITVLMKSTQREQSLCEAAAPALLATVCLFCGDEVSRQQYRRLLQSKPEAGRKVLSENSLLKNIGFNERFLGEGQMAEICDLPQRPNEAQLFYGNMSKVVLSLLGTTDASESREVDQGESGEADRGHAGRAAETDSVFANGNVSLDVLPVKGPQGPALRVSEPPSKASETSDRQQATWSVQPEQLVLSAPTMNCSATTRHARIRNNTTRELSFELSWPAHCLTITPQHGVIEPQCHLQILISPNPSLAAKASMLPWSGQIYVQCDGAQKFIKVQIRRDLDLDVSAAPAEKSLAALSPQAATPVPPVVRPHSQASQPPATPQSPQALLEIASKTVVFPATPSGESSESKLEVENGEEEVRWYLSSFAPPYVKGVDNSGDVYRATYTAFRCSRVSGTLGVQEKMQVPITFLPRDRGDYAQFWDLECHPVSDPQQKTRIRFQLCGTGVKSGPVERPHEGDCSLVKTETSVKTRKKAEAAPVKTGPEEGPRRGVYSPQDLYTFPDTRLGESGTLKVNIRNNSSDTHELNFVSPREPFHVKHSKYSLRSQHYLKLPVQFKPCVAGRHAGVLLVQSETGGRLIIQLTGEALP